MQIKLSADKALLIARNKHWRYISYYHGQWQHMALEQIEKLAQINYNAARPVPVHPGVFFDLVKIRRLVGEAKEFVVKASHEENRKRRFQRRKMACLRLAEAYRLDDVATAVAIMQETSSMEEVATQVVQETVLFDKLETRERLDILYVYFFQERIPSRQVKDHTTLESLSKIIETKSFESRWTELVAILRTRAIASALMDNDDHAVADLQLALDYHRRLARLPLYQVHQQQPQQQSQPPGAASSKAEERQRRDDVELSSDDMPVGMEAQLLFRRAGSYLALAFDWLDGAIWTLPADAGGKQVGKEEGTSTTLPAQDGEPPIPDDVVQAQLLVKKYSKAARADYMAFLNQLEYSPDYPVTAVQDYSTRWTEAEHKSLRATRTPHSGQLWANRIYRVSDLFKEVPVPNLPPWPLPTGEPVPVPGPTCEVLTFHPLLSEALHSLLLCHCLIQTSAAELIRHAYMASRLLTIANPWPLLQVGRNGGDARLDWMDVLRQNPDVKLSSSWDVLAPSQPLRSQYHTTVATHSPDAIRPGTEQPQLPFSAYPDGRGLASGAADWLAAGGQAKQLGGEARQDPTQKGSQIPLSSSSEREFPSHGAHIARWMSETRTARPMKSKKKKKKPAVPQSVALGSQDIAAKPSAES